MQRVKIVRTDAELECPGIDSALRELSDEYVLLPDGVSEAELATVTADADLLLMCYTPITESVIANATRLKGIVKALKGRGYTRANRSLVIREALRQLDLDAFPDQR